jgi:hypothetical protein
MMKLLFIFSVVLLSPFSYVQILSLTLHYKTACVFFPYSGSQEPHSPNTISKINLHIFESFDFYQGHWNKCYWNCLFHRAPFGLFYHAAWFTQPHHKEGFIAFLDTIVNMQDVWLVTNWQAIQFVRDPTPLSRINNFPPFQCNYPVSLVCWSYIIILFQLGRLLKGKEEDIHNWFFHLPD